MIPLRVRLQGFMSYRDETTLRFDAGSLHMLAGRNGAGKSTVFDAITYALYGVHRGGAQHARDLINHQSDGLLVEVDFAVGEDVYRVRRTLGRRGAVGAQAFYVAGPNPPRAGALPQALAQVDSPPKVRAWSEQIIGLNDKTFCAAVLLLQGKSEAMLDADPAVKHHMLSQLVDLSAYEHLHRRAKELLDTAAADERAHAQQLNRLEPVDESEATALAEGIETHSKAAAAAMAQQNGLAALRVHAERWVGLTKEQEALNQAAKAAEDVLGRTQSIERDAAQHRALVAVLPDMEQLLAVHCRLAECEAAILKHEAAARDSAEDLEGAVTSLAAARAQVASLESQSAASTAQLTAAQAAQIRLAGDVRQLDALDEAQQRVAALDLELTAYPDDLDSQILEAQKAVQRLAEAKQAHPWLSRYAEAHTEWRSAACSAAQAAEVGARTSQQQATTAETIGRLLAEAARSQTRVASLQDAAAAAAALHKATEDALERFESVEGQQRCSYCGQELTREHLEAEHKRLTAAIADARRTLERRRDEYAVAAAAHAEVIGAVETQSSLKRQLEQSQREAAQAAEQAARDKGRAARSAGEALAALPAAFRQLIDPGGLLSTDGSAAGHAELRPNEMAVSALLGADAAYPASADLESLAHEISGLRMREGDLEALRGQEQARNTLRVERGASAAQRDRLAAAYPSARATEIREAHRRAAAEAVRAQTALDELEQPLSLAREQQEALLALHKSAEGEHMRALMAAEAERARRAVLAPDVEARRSSLPAPWDAMAETLSQDLLGHLRREEMTLRAAVGELELLRAAEREQSARRARLDQVQRELADLPEEARCTPEAIDQAQGTARAAHESALASLRVVQDSHAELERRRTLRERLMRKRAEAAALAARCRLLSDLLGKDNLQRYLLRQAEQGIVECANEVLDRVSGGTLSVRLRGAGEGGSGAGEGGKALDLVARNTATGGSEMPVHNLSGSQRFRVAVSLALGIGRWYAGGAGGRIESVIIDEGFGSLDKEGRGEMIDELHALKDVLKRIILVSHQEEFASAFRNGYEISLVDGTSVAVPL